VDLISFFVASICHDIKHPGLTNAYHISAQTEYAVTYNDTSVLENFHIAETFRLLKSNSDGKRFNIFENFSKAENNLIRKRIIQCILATDMSFHSKIYSNLKIKIEALGISNGKNVEKLVKNLDKEFNKFDAKQELLNYILHSSDLAHNVKEFRLTKKWTELLMEEFWKQGDLEKSEDLPVSYLCDRVGANVAKGQVGFISFVIAPTFQNLVNIWPGLHIYIDNANKNVEEWKKIDSATSNVNK
jgi:hypothetical protein